MTLTKKINFVPYGDGPVWIDGGCTRTSAFEINTTAANGSTISGINMKRLVDQGVFLGNGVKDITIDGATIQDFDCKNQGPEYRAGIAMWQSGSGIRITNNTITRRSTGGLTGGLSDCIWAKSNTVLPSGGGHYIAGNTLVGCWDGIGGETEDDPRGSFDRNTIIENNTITDCEDDGVQVEGGNLNVVVRNNVVRRCSIGVASAPNLTGPLTIVGNDIREGRLGEYGNLGCFKVGDGGSGLSAYTDNTCILNAAGAVGWSQTNPGNNRIVSRGNRINVTSYLLEFSSSLPYGTSFDSDCLYTTDRNRFVKWGGVLYGSLASFRNNTGNEANGESRSDCGL